MKNAVVFGFAAALAAGVNAQVTYENGTYKCALPGAYCAGDSLKTDIIIRCNADLSGQPGRCSDNLAGEPPLGNNGGLCWQTSDTSADAACEKNCVVYGNSGNFNGTFTLGADVCTPTYTASSTAVSPTSVSVVTTTSSHSLPTSSVGSTGVVSPPGNGTITTSTGSSSATAVPVPPTSTTSTAATLSTAGAASNNVGGAMAVIGLVAAYLV